MATLNHTINDAITMQKFPDAHELSAEILNLPLHQDAERPMLAEMTARLLHCIRETA